MSESGRRELLEIYLKGLAMGSADAIPGISGGTIALITGIYERLIDSLTSIDFTNIKKAGESLYRRDSSQLKEVLADIDFWFLLALGAGIGTSVVIILNLMHLLLTKFTASTYGFFFGLIAFSAVVLMNQVDIKPIWAKIAAISGFTFAFITAGLGVGAVGHSLSAVFIAGMLAVTAMVLPGISGSLILIILGQYVYITGALSKFTDGFITLVKTGKAQEFMASSPPIIVFIIGAAIGLFSIVHIVERALKSHRNATMAFLVSMIIGALRAPILQVGEYLSTNSISWSQILPEFTIAALFGVLTILILDRKTETI